MKNLFRKGFRDKYLLTLVILFILFFFVFGRPFITGDGYGYFGILNNILNEGTITTENFATYKAAPWTFQKLKTSETTYSPLYYHGSAVSWAPFVLFTRALNNFEIINEVNKIFLTYNSFSFTDGLGVLLGTCVMGLLSVIMIYKLLCMKFSPLLSFLSVLSAYFATYSFYYTFIEPCFANVPEMFWVTLALYTFVKVINKGLEINQKSFIYLIIVGFSLGLAITCRISSALVLAVLLFIIIFIFKRKFINPVLAIGIGLILPILSLLIFSYLAYGNPFQSGMSYFSVIPLFSIQYFSLINILFDPIRGLFLWSPITLLAFITIFLGLMKKNKLAKTLLFSFTIIVFIILFYSFWYCWWAGGSVGQRFLIILTPFWSLGIALLYSSALNRFNNSKIITIIIVTFSILTCIWGYFVGKSFLIMDKSKETYTKYEYDSKNPNSISPLEQYTIFDVLKSGTENFKLNTVEGMISFPKNLVMKIDLDGRRNFPQLIYYFYKYKVDKFSIKDLELQKDN